MSIFLLPWKAVLMVSNVCLYLKRNDGNTAQRTDFLWLFFLITPLISKCRFVAKYTRVYLNKIRSNKIVIVIRVWWWRNKALMSLILLAAFCWVWLLRSEAALRSPSCPAPICRAVPSTVGFLLVFLTLCCVGVAHTATSSVLHYWKCR